MTVAEIRSLADALGYGITATKKGNIIEKFLKRQGEIDG